MIKEIQNNLVLWILRRCCISRGLVVKVLLIVCVSINAAGYMISELLQTERSPLTAAYGASKATTRGFVKPLAIELTSPGIGVDPLAAEHMLTEWCEVFGSSSRSRETIQ